MEKAIVKPLLKKPTLDHIKKNYRPVSNLSFLSKLVEKASMLSFSGHVENNNLLPEYQLWNDLPLYIKQSCDLETFKKNLKTHLFSNTFT